MLLVISFLTSLDYWSLIYRSFMTPNFSLLMA
jgi:hypothetical protein